MADMTHFDEPTPSELSRRRMIFGTSVGLLAAGVSATAHEKTAAASVNGGTLEDQIAITQLLYRYAMALDTADAVTMAECFAPNAVLQVTEVGIDWKDNVAGRLIEMVREARRQVPRYSMHYVLNHLYTVRDRSATGVTYCIATSVSNKKGQWIKHDEYLRYHDELVKQGDRWKLLKRRLENLFVTEGPVQDFADYIKSLKEK